MKIQMIGLNVIEGVSKKTGNPFKINELLYISENESYSSKDGKYNKTGYGKNVTSLNISDDIASQIIGTSFPKNAELSIGADVINGRAVARVEAVTIL